MKSFVYTSCICLLLLSWKAQAQTQQNNFTVRFNKYVFQPGDTLQVDAAYNKPGGGVLAPATLQLIIENDQGSRTRLRWPLLNGQVAGQLVLPATLPNGKYRIHLGVEPRFFQVLGKISNRKPEGMINAMILTREGDWDTQEVPVNPDGTFTVSNWLFQNNGVLAFSPVSSRSNDLDIRISTWLDSTYRPIAIATREIYLGNMAATASRNRLDSLGRNVQADTGLFSDRGALLPAVIVKAKAKSRAEQFNEAYSSGLFRAADERLINIMDDPTALSFPTLFAYLQGRVAGLQISNAGFNGGTAIWRGNPVSFFIDEIRVAPQQVSNIPMADIAIVKAYPPPFLGAPGGGNGGAIAIYTRRGGENTFLPSNRSVFQIRGYTPLTTVLKMNNEQ